jgi:hypothetical protein
MPLSSPSLTLSETDRASLQTFVHRGRANARTLTRAYILLKLAEGWTEAEVCVAFDVCRNTVVRVRQHYTEGRLEAVRASKRQQRYRQALDFDTSCPFDCHRVQPCSRWSRPLDSADAGW